MTDTTTTSVLSSPAEIGALDDGPPQKWWAWLFAGVGLVALIALSISSLLPATLVAEKENRRLGVVQPAPYAQVPASAESVNNRLVFGDLPDDVERFETDGDFFFVTVSGPQQSLLSWFAGRGDPAISLLTEEDKNGFQTPSQRRQANLQSMRTAEQEAQYVALTTVGYDAEISRGAVIVNAVLCKTNADDGSCIEEFPSGEFIDPFDTILEADGVELNSVEDLTDVLSTKAPGDTAELKISRPVPNSDVPEELTVNVELAPSPDDPDRTIVGFSPVDTRQVNLPFDVDIATGGIGGPSAGLAFTLTIIDELTDGELTGGRNIAVTGTISLDGSVGPIGGLPQKANAVLQHGVDVFIVPAAQRELVEPEPGQPDLRQMLDDAGHGEVQIVPVATLQEALDALVELGGDPFVPVTTDVDESAEGS